MKTKISLDSVCIPSKDVVARDIQGEMIIIPIASGIGDLEDEIFSLNETGRLIWNELDGKKSLRQVAAQLATQFETPQAKIEKDVLGLSQELFKRKMLTEV